MGDETFIYKMQQVYLSQKQTLTCDKEQVQQEKEQFIQYINQSYKSLVEAQQKNIKNQEYVKEKNIHLQYKPKISNLQYKVDRLFIDGCFDLTHSGHYNAIRQAKEMTNILVVGIISDQEMLWHKAPSILNFEERSILIKMCKWVDEVIEEGIQYDPNIALIDKYKCSYAAHGDDMVIIPNQGYGYKDIIDNGRMLFYPRTIGISTTEIVEKLFMLTDNFEIKESNTGSKYLYKLKDNNEIPNSFQDKSKPQIRMFHDINKIAKFSLPRKQPINGDIIVYVDGSFDCLTHGHSELLQKAKKLGTYLIVGLFDDQTLQQNIGDQFPILNQNERLYNLLSCKYVDNVILGAPWVITRLLIKTYNIQVVVTNTIDRISIGQEITQEQFQHFYKEADDMKILTNIQYSKFGIIEILERILNQQQELRFRQAKKQNSLQNYYSNLS